VRSKSKTPSNPLFCAMNVRSAAVCLVVALLLNVAVADTREYFAVSLTCAESMHSPPLPPLPHLPLRPRRVHVVGAAVAVPRPWLLTPLRSCTFVCCCVQ
jgi:hypothetical protein